VIGAGISRLASFLNHLTTITFIFTCITLLQLYHSLGIYLVLVGVEVWTSGDLITINVDDYSKTLDEFCGYRTKNINAYQNNDNAQLIT